MTLALGGMRDMLTPFAELSNYRNVDSSIARFAVSNLTLVQRFAFGLYFDEGLPIGEIADRMHKSREAAKSLLFRIRRKLNASGIPLPIVRIRFATDQPKPRACSICGRVFVDARPRKRSCFSCVREKRRLNQKAWMSANYDRFRGYQRKSYRLRQASNDRDEFAMAMMCLSKKGSTE